jgi:NADP-dependent 3-hydroxy acid dehydrogenase YdfG
MTCDITNRQRVIEMAEQIRNTVGAVNILCQNAGVVIGKSILELSEPEIHRVFVSDDDD